MGKNNHNIHYCAKGEKEINFFGIRGRKESIGFMKNMKYGTRMLAYVLGIAVFFVIGFSVGRINGRDEMKRKIQQTDEPKNVSASLSTETETAEYEIKLKNDKLYLYEVIGEMLHPIAESEISEEIYPGADVEELKRGIIFNDKTEAVTMFENFVS